MNCCEVIKLTAAMVAASHSSYANTAKKEELAQSEHLQPVFQNWQHLSLMLSGSGLLSKMHVRSRLSPAIYRSQKKIRMFSFDLVKS